MSRHGDGVEWLSTAARCGSCREPSRAPRLARPLGLRSRPEGVRVQRAQPDAVEHEDDPQVVRRCPRDDVMELERRQRDRTPDDREEPTHEGADEDPLQC